MIQPTLHCARAVLITLTSLVTLVGTVSAQCPGDDAITTNSDCASAVPLAIGTETGLSVQCGADDYWSYVVPAGQEILISAPMDTSSSSGSADVGVELIFDDGSCSVVVDSRDFGLSSAFVRYGNLSASPITVILRVRVIRVLGNCRGYSLASSLIPATDPCPPSSDDLEGENDTCQSSLLPASNPLLYQLVKKLDEDYYTFTIPGGGRLTVDATSAQSEGNVDLQLFDASDCSTVLTEADTAANVEQLIYSNLGNSPLAVRLRVYIDESSARACALYELSWSIVPELCLTGTDDAEEPNDTCSEAVSPSAEILENLFVRLGDDDYYRFVLDAGDRVDVRLDFDNSTADIDAVLALGGCNVLSYSSFSDTEDTATLNHRNTTFGPQEVFLRVFIDGASNPGGSCNNYRMESSITPGTCGASVAQDDLEVSDFCDGPRAIVPGTYTGLSVFRQYPDGEDYYTLLVDDGATLSVDALFTHSSGDVELNLWAEIPDYGFGNAGSSFTRSDNEQVLWTNNLGMPITIVIRVFVSPFSMRLCNTYDLVVDVQGGTPGFVQPFCFGDGSGTNCPCGNNSSPGHFGGCAHSQGNGATLIPSGFPSVAFDSFNLALSSAPTTSFALLLSGSNRLPQSGGCAGCGLLAFDGLRCAGGGLLRHGTRAIDVNGHAVGGWGSVGGPGWATAGWSPTGGLIAANGLLAGSTRNFFAFVRTDPAGVCATGQNSSNGVSVTIQP